MEQMFATILSCGILVSACMWLHYVVLRHLWAMTKATSTVSRPMLKILFTLFGLHLFEVLLYAFAISAHEFAGLGSLAGAVDPTSSWLENHIYFSIASYTTLGIGDIVPHGTLRLLSGVEALNGLILIAWSASFTYLVMERFWGEAHFSASSQD
jgi:hypothetical protein